MYVLYFHTYTLNLCRCMRAHTHTHTVLYLIIYIIWLHERCVEMRAREWWKSERQKDAFGSGKVRKRWNDANGIELKGKAGAHRKFNERRCYIGGYGWWLVCSVCMSFGVEVGCFTWANSMYHEEIMYNIICACNMYSIHIEQHFFGVAFAIFMDLSHSFSFRLFCPLVLISSTAFSRFASFSVP